MEPLEEAIMDYVYENRGRQVSVYDLLGKLNLSVPALRAGADRLREVGFIETIEFDGSTQISEKGIREVRALTGDRTSDDQRSICCFLYKQIAASAKTARL
jgi:hypothetical protein